MSFQISLEEYLNRSKLLPHVKTLIRKHFTQFVPMTFDEWESQIKHLLSLPPSRLDEIAKNGGYHDRSSQSVRATDGQARSVHSIRAHQPEAGEGETLPGNPDDRSVKRRRSGSPKSDPVV